MNDAQETLKTLYRALEPKPLEPTDPYYEPFVSAQPNDPIEKLKSRILFADSKSLNLVSGQRGTGKSTELLRLKCELEDSGCHVFLTDIRDYLGMTEPVEISDFMISILAALATEVNKQCGLNELEESYFTRVRRFLESDVKFEPVANIPLLNFGVNLKASLSTDASFKQQLQKAARGHVGKLLAHAQIFIEELVYKLRVKRPDCKIVYIVDSFEQLRGFGANAHEVYTSVVALFNTYGHHLNFPDMHLIIAIPPYLIPSSPNLSRYVGGSPMTTLPSIHVITKQEASDEKGLLIMQAILKRRGESVSQMLPDAIIDAIAIASGGDLRDFFRLCRDVVISAATQKSIVFPIDQKLVEPAIESLRREMLPIPMDEIQWLEQIAKTKNAELPTLKDLPQLARMFDGNLVINYKNGDDWYDIHPLIKAHVSESAARLAG